MMITWHRGRQLLVQAVKDQGMQLKELTEIIKEKASVRVAGTSFFFTPEATTIPSVCKQLLRRLHVLPLRTIFLHIKIVDVPFVLPTYPYSTALDLEDLGDGLYFACATYGYASGKIAADKIADDVLALIDRLEMEKRKQQAPLSSIFDAQKKKKKKKKKMKIYYLQLPILLVEIVWWQKKDHLVYIESLFEHIIS